MQRQELNDLRQGRSGQPMPASQEGSISQKKMDGKSSDGGTQDDRLHDDSSVSNKSLLHSGDPTTSTGSADAKKPFEMQRKVSRSKAFLTFPEKLMDIIENHDTDDAMRWNPEGDAFCISSKKFIENVLEKHFQSTKFKSFTRKLSRWGFTRVSDRFFPPGSIVYRHDQFKRGRPDLLRGKDWKKESNLKIDSELLEFLTNTQRGKMIGIDATIRTVSSDRRNLEDAEDAKLPCKPAGQFLLPSPPQPEVKPFNYSDYTKTAQACLSPTAGLSTTAAPPRSTFQSSKGKGPAPPIQQAIQDQQQQQVQSQLSLKSPAEMTISEIRARLQRNREQQKILKARQQLLEQARTSQSGAINSSAPNISPGLLSMGLAPRMSPGLTDSLPAPPLAAAPIFPVLDTVARLEQQRQAQRILLRLQAQRELERSQQQQNKSEDDPSGDNLMGRFL